MSKANKKLIFIIIIKTILYLTIYHNGDLLYRAIWVNMLKGHTLADSYFQLDNLLNIKWSIDYPPIYIYYLNLLKGFSKLFTDNMVSTLHINYIELWLMKLPSFIVDIAMTIFLYKKCSYNEAFLWIITPINIVMGAIFGQSDIIISSLLILNCYFMKNRNYNAIAIVSAIAICTKPQGLYFLVIDIIYILFEDIKFIYKIKTVLIGIITIWLIFLPFITYQRNILLPIKYYLTVMNRWGITSLGACNFWYGYSVIKGVIFGTNASMITNEQFVEKILLSIILIISCILYKKHKNIDLMVVFTLLSIYNFSLNQVCRYAYYGLVIYIMMHARKELNAEGSANMMTIQIIICILTLMNIAMLEIYNTKEMFLGVVLVMIVCTLMLQIMYFDFVIMYIKGKILKINEHQE